MVVYLETLRATGNLLHAQTMAFVTLASGQLLTAFSYRSLEKPLFRLRPWGNPWLILAVGASFALLAAAVHWQPLASLLQTVPLTRGDWALALLAALLGFLGVEGRKFLIPLFFRPLRPTPYLRPRASEPP